MSETPLANDVAARSPTGEILDVSQVVPATTTAPTQTSAMTTSAPATNATPTTTPGPTGDTLLTEPNPNATESKAPPAPEGAPEAYAAFTAPEGTKLDPEAIKNIAPIFKELNLSQAQAQKLVDTYGKELSRTIGDPVARMTEQKNAWESQTLADSEIKSAGTTAVKAAIFKAFDAVGDQTLTNEFKQVMNETGLGSHPAVVRMLWKIGQLVGEPGHIAGAGPSPAGQRAPNSAPVSAARALYPNLN